MGRVVLGILWAVAAVAVGALGWLWFALTDRPDARVAGYVLLAVAVIGAVASVAVLTRQASARRVSLAASALFVVGGFVAAVLAAANGGTFLADLLLLGGLPIVAGVVTGLAAGRAVPA